MSNANALAGLIGNYGDSGDDSDDGAPPPVKKPHIMPPTDSATYHNVVSAQENSAGSSASATIHPSPIAHCPWSACYDEGSGFTYYWNQHTNAVTWEAPPEYLLALKLAQQHLATLGSTEVSAEEWQLYQQALAAKQNTKVITKTASVKVDKKHDKDKEDKGRKAKKRRSSEDHVKIELITSYHNSDSESDHESEVPKKPAIPNPLPKASQQSPKVSQPSPKVPQPSPKVLQPSPKVSQPSSKVSQPSKVVPKATPKKPKTKPLEYGPMLPPNQNYSMPIGPDLPPEMMNSKPKSPEVKVENGLKEEEKPTKSDPEENQDVNSLLKKLKDKAKILEKLGGELPSGLEKIIRDESRSGTASPALAKEDKKALDIDDLLEQIEKKELPKTRNKKIDMFDEDSKGSVDSARNSPKSGVLTPMSGTNTPEIKPLFPSVKNMDKVAETLALLPAVTSIEIDTKEAKTKPDPPPEQKNIYISDNETVERSKKKLRISNSVLPERKKAELPSYTTKYSQHIEGFSGERTGLGFSNDNDAKDSKKPTISYGKGLLFTKGEVLNQDRQEPTEDLGQLTDLVEAKLKYLNQLQPAVVTPLQEMLIQMQTLSAAWGAGALAAAYWRRWARAAAAALAAHERAAAPPGWSAAFCRSEGRYRYVREADGFEQWEYPAVAATDMDICTTPPPPPVEPKEPPPPPPPPLTPPPPPARVATPPPPAWADPPPPGCDDPPPLPPTRPTSKPQEPKQEIGDELLSFYNDIALLEQDSIPQPVATETTPEHTDDRERDREPVREREKDRETEREKQEKEKDKDKQKKKTKVKISSSVGLKHKSVSNMVAKWQQVADEIHSD